MNKLFLFQHVLKISNLKRLLSCLLGAAMLVFIISCNSKAEKKTDDINEKTDTISLKVEKFIDNMEPLTDMIFIENGDVWITEQAGKIWVSKEGKRQETPLLDLGSKLVKIKDGYEEKGLLGITLHPSFQTNKKFYVFYSEPSKKENDHTGVVAEYKLSDNGFIDPNSGRTIISIEEPQGNHNGGCIKFGPDGYLYISLGDGGGQHDNHGDIGNGQDRSTLLGSILRIDVNTEEAYKVPSDNPFVGQEGVRPEIWAYGFRNPYRISFDSKTGEMFVGEVGQDLWEEVDIVVKGGNYGWKIVEGSHCHNDKNKPDETCDTTGIIMPIAEYDHKEGISITGGYVYRGTKIPELDGNYVFADWTGPTFYLENMGDKWERNKVVLENMPKGLKITGISEDREGELYFLTNPETGLGNQKCAIYKIVK